MCRKVCRGDQLPLRGVAVNLAERNEDEGSDHDPSSQNEHPSGIGTINQVWRAKVTQWCYDYMDCIQERRTLVYIAMNLLDRYIGLLFDHGSVDQTTYRIAALSCTYLAIRIAGSNRLDLEDLVVMSRGTTTTREIVRVGTDIVERLSWDQRMETPTEHIHRYGRLLGLDDVNRLERAIFMVEVAVFHPSLLTQSPKLVAAAALLRVLHPGCVPKLVKLLQGDDVKNVYDISHQLGIFCRECVGNTVLMAELPMAVETTVHIIMDEDEVGQNPSSPSPILMNGVALIPNDDMDES